MKNIYLTIIFITTNILISQKSFDLYVGANYSMIKSFASNGSTFNFIPSIHPKLGLDINFEISKKISLDFGFGFIQYGANSFLSSKYINSFSNPNERKLYESIKNLKINYYQLPLNVNYNITNMFKAGIGYSLLYEFQKNTSDILIVSNTPPRFISASNKFIHTLNLNFTTVYKNKFLRLNYQFGINSIADNRNSGLSEYSYKKIQGLQAVIGYTFIDQ